MPIFKKNFVSPKMAAILNFQIFHKNTYISKIVLDRAFSTKFLTHRGISVEYLCQFSKKFCLTKNGGHFEFSNFSQKLQNTKMLISGKPY